MPPERQETRGETAGLRPDGRILAVDATGDPASVAVATGGTVLGTLVAPPGERAGRALHRLIGEATERWLGDAPPDLLVAVRGPGSFTGLRVGLATVLGLALGWARPAVGVEASACLAVASGASGRLFCLADGGQGRLFVAVHVVTIRPLAVETLLEIRDASPEEAVLLLAEAAPDGVVLRGSSVLPAGAPAVGVVAVDGPLAGAAARLAAAGLGGELTPLYAREPSIRPARP